MRRSMRERLSPDPDQGTVHGCKCKTACSASVDDLFNCDWCETENNCGHKRVFGGSWDYCTFNGNATFEALSYKEKNDYFWDRVTADTKRAPGYAPASKSLTESIQTTFDNMRDELPAGRVKGIHTIGAVCQFNMTVSPMSPYTGLFGSGESAGFIRLGGAVAYSDDGFPPGIGVKFARTGVHSGNYVALVGLDTHTFNFFKYNFSNHIGTASSVKTKVLVKKFQQASQCAPQVGLSDMARFGQDGVEVAHPKTPFKLYLVPSAEVQQPESTKTVDEVNAEIESYPVGTRLFTVWACGRGNGAAESQPTSGGVETACGDPFRLGDMVTTTRCTTSTYGDDKFFFRHQRIEEDWQLHPEFLDQYDASTACDWSPAPTPQGTPKKCKNML